MNSASAISNSVSRPGRRPFDSIRLTADGDGPVEVNGYFLIVSGGQAVPNPLWQFDGNVDLLPG